MKSRNPPLYTLDTSVIAKSRLLDEELAGEALALFEGFARGDLLLVTSMIAQWETASMILTAVREREISDERARTLLESLFDLGIPIVGDLNETQDIILRAYPVARELGRSISEASFLVVAASLDAPLITADRGFFEATKDSFQIIWLGEFESP